MADESFRLDLTDEQTRLFCLSCGAHYLREVETCATCQSANLLDRVRLSALLHAARPLESPRSFAGVLVPLDGIEREHLPAIQRGLQDTGEPHLVLDASRRPLDPAHVAQAATILVPEQDTELIRTYVDEWIDGRIARHDIHEHELESPALLCAPATSYELAMVRGRLDDAGIRYSSQEVPPQFGLTVQVWGSAKVFVNQANLEQAKQAIEVSEPEAEAPPPTESATVPSGDADDMQSLREQRRYRIARWFLVPYGVTLLLVGFLTAPEDFLGGILSLGAGVTILAVGAWSIRNPRGAFHLAFLTLAGIALAVIWLGAPILMIPNFITLAAVFFAHQSAVGAQKAQASAS